MATIEDLEIGSRVLVYNQPDGSPPLEGEVVVINDPVKNPGKLIGVKLDRHHPMASGLDALLDGQGKPYKVGVARKQPGAAP